MRPITKAWLSVTAVASLILPGSVAEASARGGGLDLSFGVAGRVTTDFAGIGNADTGHAVVVQPNGRIVVAGTAGVPNDIGVVDFGLARYLPGGALDPSFGTGGKVTTDAGCSDGIDAMAALPDGRLLVAGSAYRDGVPGPDFALARYHHDGTLDRTFGSGGLVWTDFGYEDAAHALVLQPDGKVVAAGQIIDYLTDPPVTGWALARYNRDGSLDRGFGNAGRVATFLEGTTGARALARQPDGKLIVADQNRMMRYDRDGTVDTRFGGGDGTVFVNFSDQGASTITALANQGDKLIVAGSATTGNGEVFGLARFTRDGRSDLTFGKSGTVLTRIGRSARSHTVAVRAGELIAAGTATTDTGFDFALASYDRNGSLDPSFGDNGTLTTDFHANYDEVNALAFQPDGRLIAAGAAYPAEVADFSDFAVARYRLS